MTEQQGGLIILRGLPGSGKTTWAREYLLQHPEAARVNRDDIRAMLHNPRLWSPEDETATSIARNAIIRELLELGRVVISDDTNLNRHHIDTFQAIVEAARSRIIDVVTFTTPLEECIRRDSHRSHPVGELRIRQMAESMELDSPFYAYTSK